MASNIAASVSSWSSTAASNQPDSTDLASTLREDLQAIQAGVRLLRSTSSITGAGTTDLATVAEEFITVTGTATITALGTVSAGMTKTLTFADASVLTHSASLLLPDNVNITTKSGDWARFLSLGSGNWVCTSYTYTGNLGTWTPAITFATAGNLSVAYSTQYGTYQLSGKLVTANFNLVTSTFTHTTASGLLEITGLPFSSANVDANAIYFGTVQWSGITASGYTDLICAVANNDNKITFGLNGSGVNAVATNATHVPTAGSVILRGSISYRRA